MKSSVKIGGLVLLFACFASGVAQTRAPQNVDRVIATSVLVQIIRAEDERRWDDSLKSLLAHEDPKVRKRAALAAGRIGNEGAVPVLADMLVMDRDADVRQMSAFALGEIESAGGAYALVEVLKRPDDLRFGSTLRARAVEALGKIVAAIITVTPAPAQPEPGKVSGDDRLDIIRAAIVNTLRFENSRRSQPDRLTILLALTAVLRAKPDGVGKLVAEFLDYSDPRIVADALNTLARLRLKDGNDKARELLVKHSDPVVRANAARELGATEDKKAFDALLDRALNDQDLRVRVSAIRALGALKDERAAQPLFDRMAQAMLAMKSDQNTLSEMRKGIPPSYEIEWLETWTTLGNMFAGKTDVTPIKPPSEAAHVEVGDWNRRRLNREFEIAGAKSHPVDYVSDFERDFQKWSNSFFADWRRVASVAQGLGIIATLPVSANDGKNQLRAQKLLVEIINDRRTPALALPDLLNAYSAFKPEGLADLLRRFLKHQDIIVRATAAELIGNQPPSDANTRELSQALPHTLRDADNDAALAILNALAKQKNQEANDAIKTALESKDHLIRRRAVAVLKANGVGDFSDRIGTVQTRNTEADYRRAIARIGRKATATVVTSKGSFTIEFLPKDAPLTVDNFIQLAKKGFFNGQTIPRVVPNFVVQAGDPRGDQNGGPGYTIRCEINEVPYERAAVGMALSGKDTGGSQWFVTHSPQPHLDGGYTVFGRVIRGMEVIDRIARGDRIVRVIVNER